MLIYRPSAPGEKSVAFQAGVRACWGHRAQLLRSYGGARGAVKIQSSLRERGVDPALAERTVASMAPLFDHGPEDQSARASEGTAAPKR